MPSGGVALSVGRGVSELCGQIGRFVHACASRTWPMSPASSHSQIWRMPSPE